MLTHYASLFSFLNLFQVSQISLAVLKNKICSLVGDMAPKRALAEVDLNPERAGPIKKGKSAEKESSNVSVSADPL